MREKRQTKSRLRWVQKERNQKSKGKAPKAKVGEKEPSEVANGKMVWKKLLVNVSPLAS
jgi:hypothetical protein